MLEGRGGRIRKTPERVEFYREGWPFWHAVEAGILAESQELSSDAIDFMDAV